MGLTESKGAVTEDPPPNSFLSLNAGGMEPNPGVGFKGVRRYDAVVPTWNCQ